MVGQCVGWHLTAQVQWMFSYDSLLAAGGWGSGVCVEERYRKTTEQPKSGSAPITGSVMLVFVCTGSVPPLVTASSAATIGGLLPAPTRSHHTHTNTLCRQGQPVQLCNRPQKPDPFMESNWRRPGAPIQTQQVFCCSPIIIT